MNEEETNQLIGKNLRIIRKGKKVSQEELAEDLNIHQTAICRIEKGKQRLTPFQIITLEKVLKTPFKKLIDPNLQPPKKK